MKAPDATSLAYFCGREREIQQTLEQYRRCVEARNGGFFLVMGPAGIGKTWFCHKLLETISRGGLFPLVLRHRFTGDEELDQLCAGLARQAAHQRPNDDLFDRLGQYARAVLSPHLPELIAVDTGIGDRCDSGVFWRRWFAETAVAEEHGVLLEWDDIQQASPQVWGWMSELCRTALTERLPLTIVAGLRRSAETSSACRQADDLVQALREERLFLKADDHRAEPIPLPPLTPPEVGQLLDKIFGTGFTDSFPDFLQWLMAKAGGNPFFTGLLVQSSVASEMVVRDPAGNWSYRPLPSSSANSIDDLVARRIMDALSEPTLARPLRMAVALGDGFRFDDWQRMLGRTQPEAIELLLALERRNILDDYILGGVHRVQFAHPLLLEAFRSLLPQDEQRACHTAAAELFLSERLYVQAFDQLIAARTTADKLAPLLPAAVEWARAHQQWMRLMQWADAVTGLAPGDRAILLLAALESANLVGRSNDALRLYERMEEVRPALSFEQAMRLAVEAVKAVKHSDPRRALAVLEAALEQCPPEEPGCWDHRKNLLFNKLNLLEETHEYRQALELSRELLGYGPDDPAWTVKICNTVGMIHLRQGDWERADRLFRDEVIPNARRYSEPDLAQSLCNRGAVLVRLCRFAEAQRLFDQALAIADKYMLVAITSRILNSRGNAHLRQGRYRKALSDKERAARIAFATGDRDQLSHCLNDIAGIRMEMGDNEGVIELFRRSLKIKEELGNRAGAATTMNNIAECHLRGIGTPVDCRQALDWALQANAILRELNYSANLVDNLTAISGAHLGLGARGPALEYADQALAAAERQPTPYTKATALAQKAAVLCAIGSDQAEEPMRTAAELFHDMGNRHAQARVLRQLADFLVARGQGFRAREILLSVRGIYLDLKLDRELAGLVDRYPELLGSARPSGPEAAARTAGLRISVLGPFRVIPAGADQPIADRRWGSKLGRLLLAYLLTVDFTVRQGVERERLLADLWGGAGGGASMRVLLHRLRRSLNRKDAVLFAGGRYSFNWRMPDTWIDREQMEARYKRGLSLAEEGNDEEAWDHLEQAEALFAGEYLEGIDLPWAVKARKSLRTVHSSLLERLAQLSEKLDRSQTATFYRNKMRALSDDG